MQMIDQSHLKFRVDPSHDVNLQLLIVGIAVFSFLLVAFYVILGLLLRSRAVEITVTKIFSFVVLLAMSQFVWCTAIDPMDKISYGKRRGPEAMVLVEFCANSSSLPFQFRCLIHLPAYFFFLFFLE